MVPQRTLNPVWSPDSKWIAYSSRLRSLYHAIFVSNVETGETKQVTDGLADAVWPAWDASGKYLWFLASTDFGLRSQWLDMTSYDRDENFGLYFAVLKKRRRVRCCRRVTKIAASGTGPRVRHRRRTPARRDAVGGLLPIPTRSHPINQRPPRVRGRPSPSRSISTDCSNESSRFPAFRNVSTPSCKPVLMVQVYYLEAAPRCRRARRCGRRQHPAAVSRVRSPRDNLRRAVSPNTISAPTAKAPLPHRRRRWRTADVKEARAAGRRHHTCSSSTPIESASSRPRSPERVPPDVSRAEGRVQTDLQRRLAQPTRLSLRAEYSTGPTGRR